MRQLVLFVCLLAAPDAGAQEASGLSGKWQISINVGGNQRDQSCTFSEKEASLTGTCATERGAVQINGKVDGNKVSWTYKSDYSGNPLTVSFRGNLESATKITGSVAVEEMGFEGDFTATRAQ